MSKTLICPLVEHVAIRLVWCGHQQIDVMGRDEAENILCKELSFKLRMCKAIVELYAKHPSDAAMQSRYHGCTPDGIKRSWRMSNTKNPGLYMWRKAFKTAGTWATLAPRPRNARPAKLLETNPHGPLL